MATKTETHSKGKMLRCSKGFKFVKKGKHSVILKPKGRGAPIASLTCRCSNTTIGCGIVWNDTTASCDGTCGREKCAWRVHIAGLSGDFGFLE